MLKSNHFLSQVFKIQDKKDFEELAFDIFHFQAEQNLVYKNYLRNLKIDLNKIDSLEKIPFLPIEFFKHHKIVSSLKTPEIIFKSSGTTSMTPSKHYVTDLSVYEQSYMYAFSFFFGNIKEYCVLALLPSYLEREGSSLVYMANKLIMCSDDQESGFFLKNYDELSKVLMLKKNQGKKVILLGVSYALLDLAENYEINFPELIIMETGGMKGKRKEMIRKELHQSLSSKFNVKSIYSEYGMTELLSQAYSKGNGIFETPSWMKVLIRDTNDPFTLVEDGISGGINIIDLANINSCSFIMTQDLGKLFSNDKFEILGRFDASDIRGCNLLVE